MLMYMRDVLFLLVLRDYCDSMLLLTRNIVHGVCVSPYDAYVYLLFQTTTPSTLSIMIVTFMHAIFTVR